MSDQAALKLNRNDELNKRKNWKQWKLFVFPKYETLEEEHETAVAEWDFFSRRLLLDNIDNNVRKERSVYERIQH